jgi:hypothetical protein
MNEKASTISMRRKRMEMQQEGRRSLSVFLPAKMLSYLDQQKRLLGLNNREAALEHVLQRVMEAEK